eukprot:1161681-Pelagomonas_calceolata.AAC.22
MQLVPGAAPCGLADADWGTTPSCHKARSMFNSSVAARSKGWFDGLGNVMAVACLPVSCGACAHGMRSCTYASKAWAGRHALMFGMWSRTNLVRWFCT